MTTPTAPTVPPLASTAAALDADVFAFEGFCGHPTDFPRFVSLLRENVLDPVVRPLLPEGRLHYRSQRRHHVRGAIRKLQRLDAAPRPLVVMGYSNGGHAAVDFARRCAALGRGVDLLATIDAVPRLTSMHRATEAIFTRPPLVGRWVNFHQRTDRKSLARFIPLRGRSTPAADLNVHFDDLGILGHLHICAAAAPRLRDELLRLAEAAP